MRVVTKALLKKIAACDDGTKYAVKSLLGKSYSDAIRQCIADDQLQWANWGIVRVMDETERVKYAIYAAKQVLKIFEDKYKDDKRPREAIESAERWTRNPSEKNRNAAYATYAASDAANAAVNAAAYAACAAAYAAYAAAYAATYAASDAANAAVNADDTYAAANANAYAADATYAANAYAAAYVAMRIKILKYGILLLSKQAKGEPND
jgi:hypothetical protein